MKNNPFEPPQAELRPGKQKPQNSVWWKVLFWITSAQMSLVLIAVPLIEGFGVYDYIDIIFSVVVTVGLFGFAFYKPIGTVLFWRYFFYAAIAEAIVYTVVLPLVGGQRLGEETALDGWYVYEFLYSLLLLCALNIYAYKRPFIWV